MKKSIILVSLVAFIVGVYVYFLGNNSAEPRAFLIHPSFDPSSATFFLEGETVTLAHGVTTRQAAPGSSSQITTRYFGNKAAGDLNGDAINDYAFLVMQETGGSGIFYYVVAALSNATGYTTTRAEFLGDRIAPQSTRIADRILTVYFADRLDTEPMSATPSIGKMMQFQVDASGQLRLIP